MRNDRNTHLQEEQILRSIVDEAELSASLREHLSACPVCNAQRERLCASLDRLGDMAANLTPPPPRIILDYAEQASQERWWQWNWRGTLAAGMAVASLIVFLLGFVLFRTSQQTTIAELTQEMTEDERLIIEIAMLEEDPLPDPYHEMLEGIESDMDEEVPDEDEAEFDSLSPDD